MGKIDALALAAVETQWGIRPVMLASDVNDPMRANLVAEFYAPVADPSHNIGTAIDPSPGVAGMYGLQATGLKELGTRIFEAIEDEINGSSTRD